MIGFMNGLMNRFNFFISKELCPVILPDTFTNICVPYIPLKLSDMPNQFKTLHHTFTRVSIPKSSEGRINCLTIYFPEKSCQILLFYSFTHTCVPYLSLELYNMSNNGVVLFTIFPHIKTHFTFIFTRVSIPK